MNEEPESEFYTEEYYEQLAKNSFSENEWKKIAMDVFENKIVKQSKLSREDLITDMTKNMPKSGKYCIKCHIGEHENCKRKTDLKYKCECKRCTREKIAKKWR